MLSHFYLQVFYFTPAFLIFFYSIFLYFLLKMAKFRSLEVLARRTLKSAFNLVNCNCGSFNFHTLIGGQCTTNNPSGSNCVAAWEYGWSKSCEFQEMFWRRPTNMKSLRITSSCPSFYFPLFIFCFLLPYPFHCISFHFHFHILFLYFILFFILSPFTCDSLISRIFMYFSFSSEMSGKSLDITGWHFLLLFTILLEELIKVCISRPSRPQLDMVMSDVCCCLDMHKMLW